MFFNRKILILKYNMQNPRTFWMSVVSLIFMLVIIVLSTMSLSDIKKVENEDMQTNTNLQGVRSKVMWSALLAGAGALISLVIMWYAYEGSAGAMAKRFKGTWSGALRGMQNAE